MESTSTTKSLKRSLSQPALNQGSACKYHRTTEIGFKYPLNVQSTTRALSFTRFLPLPGDRYNTETLTLYPKAISVMDQALEDIKKAVDDYETLQEDYVLELGGNYRLSITVGCKCVGIRKFYVPKHDAALMLPGNPGIALNFEEFHKLSEKWEYLTQIVDMPQPPKEPTPVTYTPSDDYKFNNEMDFPY